MVDDAVRKAAVLIEALPYIRQFHGQVVVVKLGGSSQEDPNVVKRLFADIDFMLAVGMRPVVVYGGGKKITAAMKKLGKEAVFVHGQRVTDPETMNVVASTLIDDIGNELIGYMQEAGGKAALLNGRDQGFLRAVKKGLPSHPEVDLQCVGEPVAIDSAAPLGLLEKHIIPLIAPVAKGVDGQAKLYNINGDTAASLIARELKAAKLVFLSDTDGIYQDIKNPASLISSIHEDEVAGMIEKKVIAGGMIPKVTACIDALNEGVRKTHIINGYQPHSLLLEIFTTAGVGTEIIR